MSWQITPHALLEDMAAGGDEVKRALATMMEMSRLDVAAIDAARWG